ITGKRVLRTIVNNAFNADRWGCLRQLAVARSCDRRALDFRREGRVTALPRAAERLRPGVPSFRWCKTRIDRTLIRRRLSMSAKLAANARPRRRFTKIEVPR